MKSTFQKKHLYIVIFFILFSCEKPFFQQENANILFTGGVIEVGFNTAIVSGDFIDVADNENNKVIEYGHVWSTTENPTVRDNKFNLGDQPNIGQYNSFMSSLTPETTYFARAYVLDNEGLRYGENVMITPGLVSTDLPFNISGEGVFIKGLVSSLVDTANIQAFGHVWGFNSNPTLNDNSNSLDLATDLLSDNSFESFIDNLQANSTYYVRAYITDSQGLTTYGNQFVFDTGE